LGVVVTHGTDNLEETAYFLHAVLGAGVARTKPVVLTGAMRPASALSPDGPQNLLDAVALASEATARSVVVAMAGTVFAGLDVQKIDSYRREAFHASDAGPLGYIEAGRLRMVRDWPAADGDCVTLAVDSLPDAAWPRVEIVTSQAGASGAVVDALLAQSAVAQDSMRGMVLAATGNGTVHRALEAALLRASVQGVAVFRATRCSFGRVIPIAGDVLAGAGGLSPVKARIRMMLSMMQAGT